MIQRRHRVPPALPARRGMLAPWFRGRPVAEVAAAGQPAPPSGPAEVADPPPVAAGTAPAEPAADAALPFPRPAYGQRVF